MTADGIYLRKGGVTPGWEKGLQGQQESWGSDTVVVMGSPVYVLHQSSPNCTSRVCSLLYVNYASVSC